MPLLYFKNREIKKGQDLGKEVNQFKDYTAPPEKPIKIKLSIWIKIPSEYVTICKQKKCDLDHPINEFVKEFIKNKGNLRLIAIEPKQ